MCRYSWQSIHKTKQFHMHIARFSIHRNSFQFGGKYEKKIKDVVSDSIFRVYSFFIGEFPMISLMGNGERQYKSCHIKVLLKIFTGKYASPLFAIQKDNGRYTKLGKNIVVGHAIYPYGSCYNSISS